MCDIGQAKCDSMFYKNLTGNCKNPLDFPFERFKTLIDEVRSFHPYIAITTTEPFLYPYIFDAIDYARSSGLLMNITTNGLLLEKRVDEILDSGLHRLSVSLDGPPRIHDEMRGVPGTYDKVINGLRMLDLKKKERGMQFPEVLINSFVCDTNHAYLLEFVESLPKDLISHVNIKLMVYSTKEITARHNSMFGHKYPATEACMPDDFAYNKFDIALLYQQTKEIAQRFKGLVALHFEPDFKKFERYFYRPSEFMDDTRCVLPWFVSQILTSGHVNVLTRCYNIDLGNIMEKPFAEVWNGDIMRQFRKDLQKYGRFPGCARCDGVLYR
jgi:MoaA/NifB/PqqE/SkfB family radical SAM enzyme